MNLPYLKNAPGPTRTEHAVSNPLAKRGRLAGMLSQFDDDVYQELDSRD